MKSLIVAITCLFFSVCAGAAKTTTYKIAHTKQRDVNMVFVVTNSGFFSTNANTKERWWTDMRACARSANIAGDVVMVANVNGVFNYYGPKNWGNYLKSLDMAWVNARLNKQLTCTF